MTPFRISPTHFPVAEYPRLRCHAGTVQPLPAQMCLWCSGSFALGVGWCSDNAGKVLADLANGRTLLQIDFHVAYAHQDFQVFVHLSRRAHLSFDVWASHRGIRPISDR